MEASSRPLFILGTGGLAREIAQLLRHVSANDPPWRFEGFVSEKPDEIGHDLGFGTVVGDDAWLLGNDLEADLVLGVGRPRVRRAAIGPYLAQGDRFGYPNLVHPTAVVEADLVRLGRGNTIGAGCVFTCDITVGDFNHFNLLMTLGHDAVIGSFNVINPGCNLSGGVTLGDAILVGTGAQILEGIPIDSDATIGAGAVVVKPVGAGSTVVGIPAKPLEPRS